MSIGFCARCICLQGTPPKIAPWFPLTPLNSPARLKLKYTRVYSIFYCKVFVIPAAVDEQHIFTHLYCIGRKTY